MKNDLDWYLVKHYFDGIEIWKTPVKYCVCHSYCKKYKFVNSLEDAKDAVSKIRADLSNY